MDASLRRWYDVQTDNVPDQEDIDFLAVVLLRKGNKMFNICLAVFAIGLAVMFGFAAERSEHNSKRS